MTSSPSPVEPKPEDATELKMRLGALAADIERHDMFGGTRSSEAARDIRSAIGRIDRLIIRRVEAPPFVLEDDDDQ